MKAFSKTGTQGNMAPFCSPCALRYYQQPRVRYAIRH